MVVTDLLFVELGAIVTGVLGEKRCTVELCCDLAKPSYGRDLARRVEVDLSLSLDELVDNRGSGDVATAARRARYDQTIPIEGLGCSPLGPSWPGGEYEGVLTVLAEVVKADPVLAAAAAKLAGRPWEY